MRAEIITIGDEILIGQIVDTNSQWIGQELNKIGVSVYQISSIQDDRQHILQALEEAQNRADIVIITGGLGPTNDDITKKTIAEFFDDHQLVYYPEVTSHIKEMFKKSNHDYTQIQEYQAKLPSKATMLFNHYGTAPGMWFFENDTIFVSLPGVPYEMKGLITNDVLPRLQEQFQLPFIFHLTINTFGLGESIIAQRIVDVENSLPDFIKLAYLPSLGGVRLRLSGNHYDKLFLEATIGRFAKQITNILSDIISGIDANGTIEYYLGQLLTDNKLTMATAESMTGGKLASKIVSVPGASNYFKGSLVTYTKESKEILLGVPEKVINEYTVVSKEVAQVMAKSVREKLNVDIGLAITGNAGPTTDVNTETLGLVFIAVSTLKNTEVFEFNFGQPRQKVIDRTVSKALELLVKNIRG